MISLTTIERVGELCTGCSSCVEKCPKHSISFVRNEEGFDYPVVDASTCVECGICIEHCHIEKKIGTNQLHEMYAGFGADKQVRHRSSSGGAFATFAHYYIAQRGGIAFGAAIDSHGHVSHRSVEKVEEIVGLQKSKYVQSSTEGVFPEVERCLQSGRAVVFSGCPCQVAGLKAYLGKEYDTLTTIDLICHGVPSPGFWESHIESLIGSSHVESITFRRKDSSARTTFSLDIEGIGVRIRGKDAYDDPYMALFVTGVTLRECCYECHYANSNRVGDITLGDCASSDFYPKFYPWEQLSTIAINTAKGRELWNHVKSGFVFRAIDPIRESSLNAQLSAPSKRPELRSDVFRLIKEKGPEFAAALVSPSRTYCSLIKRVLKHCIPNPVRGRLIWFKAMMLGE